jgi:hypothetical protein
VPKGIMVVQSRPSDPAREQEFNDWYGSKHLPAVLAVPGIVAARRYRARDQDSYLAIYELDSDDLAGTVNELRARSASGQVPMSDVLQLDPPPVVTLYELIE